MVQPMAGAGGIGGECMCAVRPPNTAPPTVRHGARGARPEQNLSMGRKGKSEGKFGSKMVKVALIKAIGKTVKDPALLET